MSTQPLIHVIIPVFNCIEFLKDAVHSVLDHPCKRIDLVLIDDGSTDGSGPLCDLLAEQYERVSVIHQENSGVSAAQYNGIDFFLKRRSLKGFFAFLDADDYWCPQLLTDELVDMIAESGRDIIGMGTINCYQKELRFSRPQRYSPRVLSGGESSMWKLTNHFAAHLYRVKLIKDFGIRFYEHSCYSEDKFFRLQCAYLADGIELLPYVFYVYRENASSAMARQNSVMPSDYYLPIVDGWLWTEKFLNDFSGQTGNTQTWEE